MRNKSNILCKIWLLVTVLLITITQNQELFAETESTASPAIQTFAVNNGEEDNLGALSNSVNIFTGDLSLPLNLLKLSGRNGMDVSVSMTYNSNVNKDALTRNLESPTGITGLGWSLEFDKIVVDHKNTGTRQDDDFYLAGKGSNIPLVRVNSISGNPTYETKKYKFWKIIYYPSEERWKITNENGTTIEYGDKNSGRNTVQWGIKWGNWIGSSIELSGRQQYATAWNVSKVYNQWGDEVKYTYTNVSESVGGTLTAQPPKTIYLNDDETISIDHPQTISITGRLYDTHKLVISGVTTLTGPINPLNYSFNAQPGNYNFRITSTYGGGDDPLPVPGEYDPSYATISYSKIVGSSDKHTKVSYLSEIEDVYGRKVIFNYGNKSSNEYKDPHTEASEPDAYQEKYETKYLDNIEVKNENGLKMFSIDLNS